MPKHPKRSDSAEPPDPPKTNPTPREQVFDPSSFTVVRLEDIHEIAHLRADLIVAYQPVNSEELSALEGLALARQTLLRCARLQAGMYTAYFNEALDPEGRPLRLLEPELVHDVEVLRQHNRNYVIYEGFSRLNGKSRDIVIFLRMQAQAERLHRRAIEEWERVRKLRAELVQRPIVDPEPAKIQPAPLHETVPSAPPPGLPMAPVPQSEPPIPNSSSPDPDSSLPPADRRDPADPIPQSEPFIPNSSPPEPDSSHLPSDRRDPADPAPQSEPSIPNSSPPDPDSSNPPSALRGPTDPAENSIPNLNPDSSQPPSARRPPADPAPQSENSSSPVKPSHPKPKSTQSSAHSNLPNAGPRKSG